VDISRHDLQQFMHYTLPRKYLAGVEEHIAVARALGDALEHLGAPAEYVELCRSPETVALLRLWAVDEDAAFAQFAAFADASGLEPPDLRELQWQPVMGLAEARTREVATLALERALESGDTRRRRSWARCSASPIRTASIPRDCSPCRPNASTAGRAGAPRRGERCSSRSPALCSTRACPSGRPTTSWTGCSTRRAQVLR
jgi:hypothetical protein